ncbi:zinc carboxypeptidase [Diaporthe amygdali]|uniref:zinc carboxypeptidase n=1 Tax=Phomopsis amygdali TaxID=1214568 RepID=UPI0022FDB640|nr:zinc carboxypeptidase [Diaporthe amygdali]KAJ0117416.1 zinc carboxypeptidase [Diaporthe amygdali]
MRFSNFFWACSSLGSITLSHAQSNKKQYDGHQVLRVETNGRPNAVLKRLASISLQPWKEETVGNYFDVVVPPEKLAEFESLSLRSTTLHADLGKSIAAESAPLSTWKRQADDLSWYDTYHPYEEHIQYFEDLQTLFPNNSELISSGTSYEGRDLFGIHLWGDAGPGKPAVLYHGTVHAREWITTLVVEYLTLQLINGYKAGDNDTRAFLDSFDFYIIPIVNPDGFVYTQTTNRLWRKNRQPGPGNSTCVGRDINRNWEFSWNPTSSGASSDPCGQTYGGEAPSDSPENKGLDGLVRELRDTVGIKLYIDWHSYGQYFLFPYGYNETIYLPQLGKWSRTGSLMSETIRDSSDRRTTFTFGPGGAILYRSVGNSRDHVYSIGGADFSWTIELPDTGTFGFVLPPEQIRPTVEEQWAGQQVLYSLLNEIFFDDEGPA